jgi:hypothetical protein
MIPQFLFMCLYAFGIGASLAKHGKPKTGVESVWTTLIGTAIGFFLLWWGGFWKVFGI